MRRRTGIGLVGLMLLSGTVLVGALRSTAGPDQQDGLTRAEHVAERMPDSLVACPNRLSELCIGVADRMHADIELLYTAGYRGRNGTAVYLRMNDTTTLKVDRSTRTIMGRYR